MAIISSAQRDSFGLLSTPTKRGSSLFECDAPTSDGMLIREQTWDVFPWSEFGYIPKGSQAHNQHP